MCITMYKIPNCYLIALLGLFIISPAALGSEPPKNTQQTELVFGFLPILSTEKLFTRFAPLVDHLAKELGQPIRMETAPDFATFLKRTNNKRYDILFTAPHFYYLANKNAGYQVIVRVAAKELRAIIVARKDSDIKTVKDLKGKKLAIPDALSLGAVLVKNTLQQHGLQPGVDVILVETPSHNASLLSAYYGTTDASGLMIPPYKRSTQKVRDSMVKITITNGTPHMPISVANSVASSTRKKLQQILVNLSTNNEGHKLLMHLSWPMGFTKASYEEYQQLDWVIKQLNIPE